MTGFILLTQFYTFWTQTIHLFAQVFVYLYRITRVNMDWQDILMIVIAALLLLVWLPVLFYSVRKAMRDDEK